MSDQVRQVAVTPAQRWILLKLTVEPGKKLKGQRGRVFRRFMSAFKLDVIDETMRTKGGIAASRASNRTPAVFELTAENIEFARDIDNESEREYADELVIGPLFDALADSDAALDPTIPPYQGEGDDWTPVAAADPVIEVIEKIAAALGEAFPGAAAFIRSGAWDKPEAPAAA